MDANDFKHRHSGPISWEQGRWIPALILIGLGSAFLLNNLQIVPFHELLRYWPVVLVAVGLFRLVDSATTNERAVGAILIFMGAILLAGTVGLFPYNWGTLWPLVLIGVGLLLLVDRLSVKIGVISTRDVPVEWLHETAIFSGGKRRFKGDFKGGKLESIFGGFDINLRQAMMTADSAELEINAIFGGAEIKIPESWDVVMRGAGVFGAFADETTHPDTGVFPHPKRLIVKGAAVFGGVAIKN